MGRPDIRRLDASNGATKTARLASNQSYAAYAQGHSILVARLDSDCTFEKRCASLRPDVFGKGPVLAFSPIRANLLSISGGSRTTIWDISADSQICTIHGSGRSITASAWASHDPDILALGHVDGHISIWHLRHLSQPQCLLFTDTPHCYVLSWCSTNPPMLAACNGQSISVWDASMNMKLVATSDRFDDPVRSLSWRQHSRNNFLAVTARGRVDEYEGSDSAGVEVTGPDDSLDDGLFGDLDGLLPRHLKLSESVKVDAPSYLLAFGETAIMVLDQSARYLRLFKDLRSTGDDSSIWEYELSNPAESFTLILGVDTINVMAISRRKVECIVIPSEVVRQLGDTTCRMLSEKPKEMAGLRSLTQQDDDFPFNETFQTSIGEGQSVNTRGQPGSVKPWTSQKPSKTMYPLLMSVALPGKEKRSKKRKSAHKRLRYSPRSRPTTSTSDHSASTALPIAPPVEAMTSSLELPKTNGEDSSMPFLSPTIPSRGPSPSTFPPLGDDILLPPPETESFGSLPSTAMNDSDSDEETFDGDALKGSGTLMMPGGANVPLPKSCGAFFSPSGRLITYFPPKPRMKSANMNGLSPDDPEERSTKASRLFPLFGNLAVEGHDYEDSETDSVSSREGASHNIDYKSGLFDLSNPSDRSWPERLAPMRNLAHSGQDQPTVIVSIRNVNDLIHFKPEMAHDYQVTCDSEQAAVDSSMANAEIARDIGLDDVANIWSLLSVLVQTSDNSVVSSPKVHNIENLPRISTTPPEANSKRRASTRVVSPVHDVKLIDIDIPTIARQANHFLRSRSQSTLDYSRKEASAFVGSMRNRSRLGASWLVSQIFAWTEMRADIQMLASLSAVLLSSAQPFSRTSTASFNARSSLHASDYFTDGSTHQAQALSRTAPVLQADSRTGSFVNQSPAKPPQSSHVSSRNASQPATPYIESLSSTPPFPFPKLSRQGSRLSASGSASPEHHRSSFGAAAKYYAQSITDKISSYGTSPPARRFGTSPNNELSSSLPGGSWSKSVSFASGVEHVGDSRSSARLGPDDGYDSDRTIEDTSLPQTPKRYAGPITFTLKNTDTFAPSHDSQARPQPQSLLSPALTGKAKIWIGHYAEQLRRWDMEIKAAELDNIAGAREDSVTPRDQSVYPVPASKGKASCGICHCKIRGVQHVCSRCLHTTHLSCLKGLLDSYGSEEMECPTGCGCVCSTVPLEEPVWEADQNQSAAPVIRKKPSLTDPRTWRARIQGDSW